MFNILFLYLELDNISSILVSSEKLRLRRSHKDETCMTCMLTVLLDLLFNIDVSAQRTIVVAVDSGEAKHEEAGPTGSWPDLKSTWSKPSALRPGFRSKSSRSLGQDLFDDLDAGKFDAIMASVSITDQRKERFDFSQPYFSAEQLLGKVEGTRPYHPSIGARQFQAFEATTGGCCTQKIQINWKAILSCFMARRKS